MVWKGWLGMSFTDEELMLLEQLEYLNENEEERYGLAINRSARSSVADIVNAFDEKTLQDLDKQTDGFMSGRELAAIIRQIKNNPKLMGLKVVNRNKDVFATCYVDAEGNAYVTFQGTANGREWYDDAEGLQGTDTPCQKEALDYVESLPYEGITVIGHSKGGNKAQYVTITSKKVKRCISMDGQGFSKEFMEKYEAEISERGCLVRNYSLSTDYVHILLYPLPGASQIYVRGDEALAGARNHSPTAFYQYDTDDNGQYHIVINEKGETNLILVPENKGMRFLHEFTNFVVDVMPDDKKKEVIDYLGNILALARDGEFKLELEDGTIYTSDDIMLYVLSDPDRAALVIAYLVKYIKTYNLRKAEIKELLKAFGLLKKERKILDAIERDPRVRIIIEIDSQLLIDKIINLIDDGLESEKTDIRVDLILAAFNEFYLSDLLKEKFGDNASIDLNGLWRNIQKEYHVIPSFNKRRANKNKTVQRSKRIDYSKSVFDTIMDTIEAVNCATFDDVSSWSTYANYSWYESLGISVFKQGIYNYADFLRDINEDCKNQIEGIFDHIGGIDSRKAEEIRAISNSIEGSRSRLQDIANRLG